MFSWERSTSKVSATEVLRSRVSSDEWCSGMSRPKTFDGPRAFTAKARQVLLSMPPERATTRPRRFSCLVKMVRIWVVIFWTSWSRSISKRFLEKGCLVIIDPFRFFTAEAPRALRVCLCIGCRFETGGA